MRSVLVLAALAATACVLAEVNLRQHLNPGATAALPPIVGLQYVGRGVDVTQGAYAESQMKGQVVALTYDYGMTWMNPQNLKTYKVPDSMLPLTLDHDLQTNSTTTMNGLTDVQIWAEHTTHWSSGFLGLVSNSKTTYDYIHRYFQQDETLAKNSFTTQFLKLAAVPPPILDGGFKLSVMALPETCCGTPSDYQLYTEFFASFGQAYIQEAKLGGVLKGETWFAKCLIDVTSVHWVTQQSSWSFLGLIGGGHGHSTKNSHLSPAFNACYTSHNYYAGGDPGTLLPNMYDLWIPTTYDTPYPTDATVVPYYTLLQQTPGLTSRAAAMKAATEKFLQESQAKLNKAAAAAKGKDPNATQQCCKEAARELGVQWPR